MEILLSVSTTSETIPTAGRSALELLAVSDAQIVEVPIYRGFAYAESCEEDESQRISA
jgi:hypothetical protein